MAWTHVWCDKKWMRRRTITPIAFRDRCDPSNACKIKFEVVTSSPKFLEASWAHSSHFLNLSFWAQLDEIGWNLVSTRKNHLELAFATIKNEWYVARPSKLLCCISMIIRMPAKSNYMIGTLLENILHRLKDRFAFRWHPLFEAFSMKTALLGYENWKTTLSSRFVR